MLYWGACRAMSPGRLVSNNTLAHRPTFFVTCRRRHAMVLAASHFITCVVRLYLAPSRLRQPRKPHQAKLASCSAMLLRLAATRLKISALALMMLDDAAYDGAR